MVSYLLVLKWSLLTSNSEIFNDVIIIAFPSILEHFHSEDLQVSTGSLHCIYEISKHGKLLSIRYLKWSFLTTHSERFHDVIATVLPHIMECLKDYGEVDLATAKFIFEITKHGIVLRNLVPK